MVSGAGGLYPNAECGLIVLQCFLNFSMMICAYEQDNCPIHRYHVE
jgi:hypothetical protein|tara:strand:- start:42429 stop:42566 length:138 start_codon:yes stop_codon:yes gene_type:complete